MGGCAQYTAQRAAHCAVRAFPLQDLSRHDHPEAPSRFNRFSKAECILVFITMIWGGTFLLVQHAMTVSGPMFFVGLRFAAAAIVVGFFSLRTLRDLTLFELKAGVFIGVAIMFGYGLQTIGLQTIPSSQSAFITALYVPFVPLLQWLVLGRRPGLMPSIGIMLAFAGLMLLTGPAGASLNFSPGEIATLISAMAIAAEIILISAFAGQVDVRRVTVVQLAIGVAVVVPDGGADARRSGVLLVAAVQRRGPGHDQRGDPGGDELGAAKCFADPRHVDLCR